MKIYFSGSIRGGRDDANLYHEMIEILKTYGDVLTEHVGDMSLTSKGGDGTSEYIWKRDTSWLDESDVVIAE
ncbi:MAG: nucleoside 2-deoxyribosyltransferase, partial [Clostridia bacterium]|nr:nucleoside 2-deoxyribosyltransferase [Clostridia bacterium]